MSLTLDTPVLELKGIGIKRAEMLSQVQVHDLEGLLKYKPLRYEDRTRFQKIADLKADEEVLIEAIVSVTGRYTTPMKRMRIFEMVVEDASGSLPVKFFNQPYLDQLFQKGQTVILYGIARLDDYSDGITLHHPEYEIIARESDRTLHTGRIVPIYRRIGRLTSRMLRQVIFQSLEDLPQKLEDPLPESVLAKYQFPDRRRAFQEIHFPPPVAAGLKMTSRCFNCIRLHSTSDSFSRNFSCFSWDFNSRRRLEKKFPSIGSLR